VTNGVGLRVENPAFGTTAKYAGHFTGEVLIGSSTTTSSDTGNAYSLYVTDGTTYSIFAANGGNANSGKTWSATSDARLKTRSWRIVDPIQRVMKLLPREYEFFCEAIGNETDCGKRHEGFYAQELEEVVPDAVITGPGVNLRNGTHVPNVKSTHPMPIVAVLTAALQDQQRTIRRLTRSVKQFEMEMQRLTNLGSHVAVCYAFSSVALVFSSFALMFGLFWRGREKRD
jgi:hypothetical protein